VLRALRRWAGKRDEDRIVSWIVVDFILRARLLPEGGIPSPDPALRKNPNEIQHFAIAGVLAAERREYRLSLWTMLGISRAVAHLRLTLLGEEESSNTWYAGHSTGTAHPCFKISRDNGKVQVTTDARRGRKEQVLGAGSLGLFPRAHLHNSPSRQSQQAVFPAPGATCSLVRYWCEASGTRIPVPGKCKANPRPPHCKGLGY